MSVKVLWYAAAVLLWAFVMAAVFWVRSAVRSRRLERSVTRLQATSDRLAAERQSLEEQRERLKQLTILDPELGIPNRKAFVQRVDLEWRRARRLNSSFTVVIAHARVTSSSPSARDAVNRKLLADLKRAAPRATDLLALVAANRFGLVLTDTPLQQARPVLRRLAAVGQEITDRFRTSTGPGVSIAFKVGEANPRQHHDPDEFLKWLEASPSQAFQGLGR